MDCSLPGSSVHGIFQAIVLEWIAISFSSGSSRPRDRTQVSRIVDRRFTIWATREDLIRLIRLLLFPKEKWLCNNQPAFLSSVTFLLPFLSTYKSLSCSTVPHRSFPSSKWDKVNKIFKSHSVEFCFLTLFITTCIFYCMLELWGI